MPTIARVSSWLRRATGASVLAGLACVTAAGHAAPNVIPDAATVQHLAARHDADGLRALFAAHQRRYEVSSDAERPLLQAYWALGGRTGPAVGAFYDGWVAKFPASYEARVSRAIHAWSRAKLIAHPKSIVGVVQADSAWRQYADLLDVARHDLETARTLSAHPIVADRTLIAVCQTLGDLPCVRSVYEAAVARAPRSLLLRRGYLATVDDADVWASEIADAAKRGVSADALAVLRAEQTLFNSRRARQADGATEVRIFENIVKSVEDPWLDESAAHMYTRRKNYAEAIPLYTRALDGNPNLDDALYWRAQAYFAVGNFPAAHADTIRAATLGNPQASRDLIDFHISGEKGFPRDLAAAARWCALAADNDQSYGAFCLGDLYANGAGGYPRDMAKSMAWLTRAAELGHQTAQHDLGVTLLKGLNGQTPDRDAGIDWLRLSAQGGFDYAAQKLRMHLSRWEYFKRMTWPAYRDALAAGHVSVGLILSLVVEAAKAAFG